MSNCKLNHDVSIFLDNENHPLRQEIECLRELILSVEHDLLENIKWNGPNYSIKGEDRITLKINHPKQIQVIFHRGSKVKEKPSEKILKENFPFLKWRENDRAVATFKSREEILENREMIVDFAGKWLDATTY